jgi:hypothetical protein
MKTLSSKQKAFIKLMTQSSDQTRRGFQLLLKRSDFEEFFDALAEASLFEPANNPAPVQGDQPGFFWVPFWEPLPYLEAVAKLSGDRGDVILAEKVMSVVRTVSRWRETDGTGRDNYHTFHSFAKIYGLVPISVVTLEDVDLIPTWLQGRFDRSMVAFALAGGTLSRFIDSASPDDWTKACRIIEHCTALRWVDDKWATDIKTPATVVEDYWLKQIIDGAATPLGAKAGKDVAAIFLTRLREVYSQTIVGLDSSISRPAIEEHSQNHSVGGPNNRFVEGLRDVLLSWSEREPQGSQAFVEDLLRDEAEIARRVGIHVLDARFETMRATYQKVVGTDLFSRGHLHELYLLLTNHFRKFTDEEKSATLNAIRSLAAPAQSSDSTLALKYVQRQWLSAIAGSGFQEVDDWYAELSADSSLGPLSPHPDLAVFTQFRYGFGPTPFSVQEIVAFARDASLVERLNGFTQPNAWDGPTTHSLVETLVEAVAVDPEAFLRLLPAFLNANRPYQYGIIAGFKKLWDAEGSTTPLVNWNEAWPKLIEFFEELISGDAFWTERVSETRDLTPSRNWIPPVIAEFLRAGTRKDEKAYDPALLPRGWDLIKILVERSEAQTTPDKSDSMTRAINTPKGKAIEALLDHALRACRISDKEPGGHTNAWSKMVPVFDNELAKCQDANYEFSTLAAAYIPQIHYMDQHWCERNFERIFPAHSPTHCCCALDGLAFAPPSKPIYRLLLNTGVLDWALRHAPKQSRAREHILQLLALAYLWGDEPLDSPRFAYMFATGRIDDLEQITRYFWAVRNSSLSTEQKEKVIAFWGECLRRTQNLAAPPITLLSTLSLLACYLQSIGEREEQLLVAVAPHVGENYNANANMFLKELNRLVDISPVETCRVFGQMVQTYRPTFDYDNTISALLRKLVQHTDTRLNAIRYVERLGGQLPGMLDLYQELKATPGLEST